MRQRVLAAGTALLLLSVACSSGGLESDAGSRSRLGGQGSEPTDKGGEGKSGGKDGSNGGKVPSSEGTAPPEGAIPDVPGTTSDTTQSGTLEPPGPASHVDPSLARAAARVEEPDPDAEKSGLPPDYSEIYVASIEGLGDDFRLTLTFGGDVPEAMPDDHTYMTAGFALLMGGDEAYSFGAYADASGWKTYAGGKDRKSGDFPGTFEVSGREIVMIIPWDFVRGPRSFKWQANSGWFTQIANQTQYAFDVIPNENGARFPGR
jgi:hypothetical protein